MHCALPNSAISQYVWDTPFRGNHDYFHCRKAKLLDFGYIRHCFGQVVGPDADLHYTSGMLIMVELLQARTAGRDQKLVMFWPCFQACLPENINKPTTNRSFALHTKLPEKYWAYRRQGQGTLRRFLKDAGTSYKCFACAFSFLGEKKKCIMESSWF